MRLGIVFQNDKASPISWQKHPEIYTRTEKRVYQIATILQKNNYDVEIFNSFSSFIQHYRSGLVIDMVFYFIECCFERNTNSYIPFFLEMNHIPFIGNDSYINTITSDKVILKNIATYLKIRTPSYKIITYESWAKSQNNEFYLSFPFPCVLKYRYGSMSYLTTKVDCLEELKHELNKMFFQDKGPILCEEYIDGRELTVPIVGQAPNEEILSVIEYVDDSCKPLKLYDEQWKGIKDKYVELKIVNPQNKYAQKIISATHKLYQHLGFLDYARFDFRLSFDNTPYLLEANPLPALALDSAFDPISYGGKESFDIILQKIIRSAANRNHLRCT